MRPVMHEESGASPDDEELKAFVSRNPGDVPQYGLVPITKHERTGP